MYYFFKHYYPGPNLSYKDQGREKRTELQNKKKENQKEKNHHLCPWFETTSRSGMESCNSGCYGYIRAGEKQKENRKNNLFAIQGSGP